MSTITIEQGAVVILSQDEIRVMKALLKNKGLNWGLFDERQGIMKLPQQYVGYIQFPKRRLIIRPKHYGVTIGHILRIYHFLYSTENSDLDAPKYDVETGSDVNLISMFISELLAVIHKGIPVEYSEIRDDLEFARGKVNTYATKKNFLQGRAEAFSCEFDDLSRDTKINRVLVAAAKKISSVCKDGNLLYAISQFGDVDHLNYPKSVVTMRNTAYCKKALSLAYMILNDLTLSTDGDSSLGESLLINFDRVFEQFIQKVLMEYSSAGKFSYWSLEKEYALYQYQDNTFARSFIPDLLFDYKETVSGASARAILDMKNKTSKPFENPDVYEMSFYAQMLRTKKVILCYPSSGQKAKSVLRFINEQYYLQKIYAVYINLLGNSAREFKENIRTFILNVEELL